MRRKFGLLIAAIGLLSSTLWSQEYSLIKLGTLGGDSAIPFSVNNSGQVAGQAELPHSNGLVPEHPFLYTNGAMIDLGTLGGDFGEATSLNEHGDVAGETELSNGGVYHAFLWTGAMQDLDPSNPGTSSGVNGINGTKSVVGNEGGQGVLFSGGAIEAIPHAPWQSVSPGGINDSGQIAGSCFGHVHFRACRITGNTVNSLNPVYAHGDSDGRAINAAGDVCGSSDNAAQSEGRATLWSGGAKFNLGVLSGGHFSHCYGLNDYEQSVGDSEVATGIFSHATLYDPVNHMQDLNHLVASSKFVLLQARSISDNGYIAVWCEFGGYHNRACLLKPNSVLILKKNILALAQNDPGCIQCRTVLDPEADSLPDTLTDLTPAQQKRVVSTVDTMMVQLRRLERVGQITARQGKLLVHQSQLVIAALRTT
jgi:probable HAF family extracellular repeat protein